MNYYNMQEKSNTEIQGTQQPSPAIYKKVNELWSAITSLSEKSTQVKDENIILKAKLAELSEFQKMLEDDSTSDRKSVV